MIGNLLTKIMGSHLLKNYDVEKEPYMHGGLHNLWKIYRAKKKDRNNMDVSVFIFEKKTLDKKKLSQHQKDEIFAIMKKDPQNLAKLRHPNLLSLIEQPLEDQKFLIFVTEPVEFNLSSLQFDATKKELIPGDLEIKCLSIDLMEALNFLHNNAKMIHMGLAPEHVYITTDGKLKLGGLNFAQQFTTAESLNVPLNYDLKITEYSVVPNHRFAAPEISEQQQCSINSDLFSVGTLIYYMVALNQQKSPFLLNQPDITDKAAHTFECGVLYKKFTQYMQGCDSDLEILLKHLLNKTPQSRGPPNQIVDKSWFQDPLLKTIKYLETLDSKDHMNKVQFLQGITRILEKFDKKALLKKVIPLLLDQMKIIQLSVNVLPNILEIMEKPHFLTTTEFRDYIWPQIQKLCKAKELPAQSLFLILKNTELFMKYVGPTEFQQNFLILVNKSLECGVPKLQFLALTKVPMIIKQIEYNTVKTSIIPRILMILEKPGQVELKQKTLDVLLEIISIIDQQTMKDKILKTFEKVRATETDPQICMLMLKIYEQMAKVLGVEEIGLKILPGIIPMLISGTFTRTQFKELISSVRRLLDQIEQHREKDLRDMGQENAQPQNAFDMDSLEKSLGVHKQNTSTESVTNKDVFDFLSSLERGASSDQNKANTRQSFGVSQNNDIMSTINSIANSSSNQPQQNDPFASMLSQQQPQSQQFGNFGAQSTQQQKNTALSGWESDMPNFGNLGGASTSGQKQKEESGDDFFSSMATQNKQNTNTNQWGNFGSNNSGGGLSQNKPGPMTLGTFGTGSKNLKDDPFAELIEGSSGGNTQSTGMNLGFNNNQNNFNNFGNQSNTGSLGFNQNAGLSYGQQPQNQMNNFGGGFNAGFNNNNAFGGGQTTFNTGFGGQQQNTGVQFGGNTNSFGAFPAPKTTQQTNSNIMGGNDDFFSQFTQQKPQQQNNNTFGNLF